MLLGGREDVRLRLGRGAVFWYSGNPMAPTTALGWPPRGVAYKGGGAGGASGASTTSGASASAKGMSGAADGVSGPPRVAAITAAEGRAEEELG